MKIFGSITELLSAVFRKDSQNITVRPNQTTTYTSNRDVQLPPQDADGVLVSATSTQTLTNKTIGTGSSGAAGFTLDADVITLTNVDNGNIKAGAAIDAAKIADGSVSSTEFQYLNGLGSSAVGVSDTQTLSNKTLLTSVIDDYIDINEETAPGTPATGKVRLYAKTDGDLYYKDDTGAETPIGTGSGNINNGGNAFGSAITLGTNDNFPLNFETNNTVIATGATTGAWTLGPSGAGALTHNINGSNLAFTTSGTTVVISNATSDGSDNKRLQFSPGGGVSPTRGSYIEMYGNEYGSSVGGRLLLAGGDSADAAGSNIAIRFDGSATAGGASSINGSMTGAGAWTLGPTTAIGGSTYAGNNIVGKTNASTVGAGYVGERLVGTWLSPTVNSATQTNFMSLTLTAGVWMVYGKAQLGTAGTTQTRFEVSLSTTSATLDAKSQVQDNFAGTTADRLLAPNPIYVNTTGTTAYLVVRSTHTGTNPTPSSAFNELYAVRIA